MPATGVQLMADERLRPEHRVRRGEDFRRAFARKVKAGDDLILVYGCENGYPHPRLGMAVSRRVGGAVVRNRWKRLLREAFRRSRDELPAGVDLIVIPRAGAKPQLESLQHSLVRLAAKVGARLAKDSP